MLLRKESDCKTVQICSDHVKDNTYPKKFSNPVLVISNNINGEKSIQNKKVLDNKIVDGISLSTSPYNGAFSHQHQQVSDQLSSEQNLIEPDEDEQEIEKYANTMMIRNTTKFNILDSLAEPARLRKYENLEKQLK